MTVTVVPGEASVGENVFRTTVAPPVQKRGSLAGERNVATTFPPDSMSDFRQGGTGVGEAQAPRKLFVSDPFASKQTFTPLVLGTPDTVSVTVTVSLEAKPVVDKVEIGVR